MDSWAAFPLTNNNIGKYNYYIDDTVRINNSDYVRIKLKPKKHMLFSFHGELTINTKNYHINDINLNLVRHKSNAYHEKSIVIGGKNMVIAMPIYDFNMQIGFTEMTNFNKSYLSYVNIETAYNIVVPSLSIDTDRIMTRYEISDFAPHKTNNNKLNKKNPTRMQKRLIKKIQKIINEESI